MTLQGSVAFHGNKAHWTQTALRAFLHRTEHFGEIDLPLLGVGLHEGVRQRDDNDGRPAASEDLSGYKIAREGDVIMNRLGKPHGSVGVSSVRGITSPAYWVMEIDRSRAYPAFVHHLLRSKHLVREYERLGKYMPPNQFDISWDAFRSIEVPLPSLDEQRRIADFLDAETARIDELIRLRNLQVERFAEALRSEAGRIANPEWKPLPLRRIINSVQTGTTPTDLLRPADSGNMPWYTPAALGGSLDLNSADKSVSRDDFDAVPRFPAESILIVGIGESLGKVADLDHEATGNQQLTAICISDSADRRFVLWRLFAAYEEIRAWAQYSRIRILNNEVLKSFRIPVPPLDQQVKARQALDHRLIEFTEFRDTSARFSLLATERRQALITAAVTGGVTV